MFCRFCGKQLPDDSVFCSYCGKQLDSTVTLNTTCSEPKQQNTVNIYALSKITSIVFYVSMIVFGVLFWRMAPIVKDSQLLGYVIGIAVMICLAICVHKIRNGKQTAERQIVALAFGLMLLISSVGIRILYEAKVDHVTESIPQSGTVHLEIDMNEEFFDDSCFFGAGYVVNPTSSLLIDGVRYEDSSVLTVQLNKPYTVTIVVEYERRSNTENSADRGSVEKEITFTAEELKGGQTIKENVDIDDLRAEVTIDLVRVCSFWEVVLY